MYTSLILAALLYFFISLAYRKLGLYILLCLLPLYVLRFHAGTIPSTWLEVMAIISIFLWLYDLARGKYINQLKENLKAIPWFFYGALLIFFIGATISIFTALDIQKAVDLWKSFYLEPALLFFVFLTRFENRHHWHQAIMALAVSAVGVSILALYQKYTGWMIFNPFWQAEETRRVTSIFGFPNGVGLYLAPLVPLFVGEFIRLIKKLRAQRGAFPHNRPVGTVELKTRTLDYATVILYAAAIPTSVLAVWWARSTGALIAMLGVALIMLVYYKSMRWYVVGIVFLSLLGLYLLPAQNAVRQELFFQDFSGTIRRSMWAETVEFVRDHPLRGAGLGSYQKRIAPYHRMKNVEIYHHPHNVILNFWTETGLVGLLGFAGILVSFAVIAKKRLVRFVPSRAFAFYTLASLLAILIHGMVDVPYIKNDLSVMFWFIIALGVSAHKE